MSMKVLFDCNFVFDDVVIWDVLCFNLCCCGMYLEIICVVYCVVCYL